MSFALWKEEEKTFKNYRVNLSYLTMCDSSKWRRSLQKTEQKISVAIILWIPTWTLNICHALAFSRKRTYMNIVNYSKFISLFFVSQRFWRKITGDNLLRVKSNITTVFFADTYYMALQLRCQKITLMTCNYTVREDPRFWKACYSSYALSFTSRTTTLKTLSRIWFWILRMVAVGPRWASNISAQS